MSAIVRSTGKPHCCYQEWTGVHSSQGENCLTVNMSRTTLLFCICMRVPGCACIEKWCPFWVCFSDVVRKFFICRFLYLKNNNKKHWIFDCTAGVAMIKGKVDVRSNCLFYFASSLMPPGRNLRDSVIHQ